MNLSEVYTIPFSKAVCEEMLDRYLKGVAMVDKVRTSVKPSEYEIDCKTYEAVISLCEDINGELIAVSNSTLLADLLSAVESVRLKATALLESTRELEEIRISTEALEAERENG